MVDCLKQFICSENTAIFAHYNKDSVIDDYVIYYLNELKKIAQNIIFVSDCCLSDSEIKKLDGLADYTIAFRHGEYDFGSYKRGFQLAIDNGLLDKTENLILANDSCFGPFGSLKDLFEEMNENKCDFWGIATNENKYDGELFFTPEANNMHIQSYFVVFKNKAAHSDTLKNFLLSVEKVKKKKEIIFKYEMGLTDKLCKAGYRYYAKYTNDIFYYNMDDLFNPKIKTPCIFFKKYVLSSVYFPFILRFWFNKIERNTDYPIQVILSYLKKNRKFSNFKYRHLKKYLRVVLFG